jgi:8-oxo-dGTP diphosphatase
MSTQSHDLDNYAITLAEPNPSHLVMDNVSVDCVIFGFEEYKLKVLLIQHGRGPKKGQWALPGDYVEKQLPIGDMASKVLYRLTGLNNVLVQQLGAYGGIDRVDYRRVVTIAYFAFISPQNYSLVTGEGTSDVKWFDLKDIPSLIFDHNVIVQDAITRLKDKARTEPIGFELLPQKFTLTQLQRLYEAILGHVVDTRNFRKKVLKLHTLIDLGEVDDSAPHRAPALFSFDSDMYEELKRQGYYFEIY